MGLFKKQFTESEENFDVHTDCLCKFRGTPEEIAYHKAQGNISPDVDQVPAEEPEKVECGCSEKKSLADDMTFGQVVMLLNHLVKEVEDLKRQLNGR